MTHVVNYLTPYHKGLVLIFKEHTNVNAILVFLKWEESALMKMNAC